MAQDTLQAAKERYSDATEAFREQRTRMVEDLKFSNPADPQQWDSRARNIRENGPDGARPCLTLDHTNQYIAQVVNDARQNKPAISYLPASGGSRQEVAKALEGITRHIEYQSRAQIAYDTAVEHAARVGLGWVRLLPEVVNEALNYQEIRIKRVHDPLSIVCDPDWTEPDGSDINYGFVESVMSNKAFKAKWPKADKQNWSALNINSGWSTENGVRVCEYLDLVEAKKNQLVIAMPDGSKQAIGEDDYWKKCQEVGFQIQVAGQYIATQHKVMWRTMTGAEILEETVFPSCYIPLVPVVGAEIWIEGKRYLSGMVRRMMEAQRAYNYERSAWVEAVALQPKSPHLAAAEAIEGHEAEWGASNRSNKAYLPWNAFDAEGRPLPMPKRSEPPQLPAAFAQGAQFADNDIQASVGMYRASIGAPTQEHSGVAIHQKRQEADTANFHFTDNLSRSIERVGRITIDMITRLYDEPREARILGQDGTAKPVRIDSQGDAYSIDGGMTSINPTTGTYDVRVKAGPNYTTLRQEASDGLQQLMSNPAIASVVAPVWAEMQDWPNADKISKALLAMAPPQVQAALSDGDQQDSVEALKQKLQQVEQQAQQMHQMLDQAAQHIEQAQKDDKRMHLEYLEKAAKLENDQFDLITKRITALQTGMTPEQLRPLIAQIVQESLSNPLEDPHEIEQLAGEPPEPQEMYQPPQMGQQEQQAPSGAFSLPEQQEAQ